MTSGPITSFQMDGEAMEAVTEFIFLGSKITVNDGCSHDIKTHLLLGRKAMTNRPQIKKQRQHFTNKVHLVKAMVFPVGMYGCENWIIKKVEQ